MTTTTDISTITQKYDDVLSRVDGLEKQLNTLRWTQEQEFDTIRQLQTLQGGSGTLEPQSTISFWDGPFVSDETVSATNGVTYVGEAQYLLAGRGVTFERISDTAYMQINAAAGGTDCMFDWIVSECWAAEVTAGRGAEGQAFTSLTGCTFYVTSLVQYAWDGIGDGAAAGAKNFTSDCTVYICPGGGIGQLAISGDSGSNLYNVFFVGSNRIDSFIPGSGSAYACDISGGTKPLYFKDLSFTGSDTSQLGFRRTAGSQTLTFDTCRVGSRLYTTGFTDAGGGAVLAWDTLFPTNAGGQYSADTNSSSYYTRYINCTFDDRVRCGKETWFEGCTHNQGATAKAIVLGTYTGSSELHVEGSKFRTSGAVWTYYIEINRATIAFDIQGCTANTGATTAVYVGSTFIADGTRQSVVGNSWGCDLGLDNASTTAMLLTYSDNDHAGTSGASAPTVNPIIAQGKFINSTFDGNGPARGYVSFSAGSSMNRVNGVMVSTGAPTHIAAEGQEYFDSTANTMYVNTDGSTTWAVTGVAGGGGAAPVGEAFVTIGNTSGLSAERALTAGSGIAITDGGANSTVTVKAMRTGTIYVAASDATAAEIAGADYTCDNTADDVQIAAALAELNTAGGGRLVLSSGTFTVNAAGITLYNNIKIEGQGRYATEILLANSQAGANRHIITDTTALSNITIESITFDGNKANQTDGADRNAHPLLNLGAKTNLIIRDCAFENCYAGAALRLISSCTHVLVDDCFFTGNGKAAPFTAGYECDNLYNGSCIDVMVRNCVMLSCTDTGVATDNGTFITIAGNYIDGGAASQCIAVAPSSSGDSNYVTISGNVLYDSVGASATKGINISDFGSTNDIQRVVITGNQFVALNSAIYLGKTTGGTIDNVLINGNLIESTATGTCIDIAGVSDDVLITGNKIGGLSAGATAVGINFTAGHTATNYQILGNDLTNATTPINGTPPTGTRIIGNKGYTTHDFYTDAVKANTFQSVVVTGTAPLIVASTTKVTNLNADLLDDQTGSYYLDSTNFTGTNWTDLTDGGATTLHTHAGGAGHTVQEDGTPLTTRTNLNFRSGLLATDGGAGPDSTIVDLGPLTALWDQSGAFNIVQRGGDLLIANSKDLKLYSDNSATPSTLVGEWDGALGHIGIGAASLTEAGLYVAPTFTAPAGTRYGAEIVPTITYAGASGIAHYGAYIVPNLEINVAATQSGAHHALGSGWSVTDNGAGGTISDIAAWSPIIATAGTVIVTAARAIHVHDALVGGGSIGTFYGIDIPVLSAATLNIGIRNLATMRQVGALTIGADAAVSSGLTLDITGVVGQKAGSAYRWYDDDSSNYVGLKAPATAQTENYIYELPDDDPTAGQVLAVKSIAASPIITTEWVAAGAGGGHTIRENGTNQTARTGLNFIDADAGAGLITDDAGGDETEVNLSLYRLESQDHTHASSGLQGGTLAHGVVGTTGMLVPLLIRAESGNPRQANPCAYPAVTETATPNFVNYVTCAFDAAAIEYWQSRGIPLPDNYDGGTFTARIRWAANATSGVVRWQVQLLIVADDGAIDTAFGTAQLVDDTAGGTAYDRMCSAFTSAITAGGSPGGTGRTLYVQVYRDATSGSDTLAVDALFESVELRFGISALSA